MSKRNILAFDLYGDYALFKKPWCNREQQSFLVPPKTSIIGLVGGILGYKRENYLEKLSFNEIYTGITLLNEDGKELHGFNFMHGKNLDNITKKLSNPYRNPTDNGSLSPTRLEYIKNPIYRIFLYLEDVNLRDKVQKCLEEGRYVFPPYLGKANLFANIDNFLKTNLKETEIEYSNTVVPSEMVKVTEVKKKLYTERLPIRMDIDRSSPIYETIAVVKDGKIPLKESVDDDYIMGKTNENERLVLI